MKPQLSFQHEDTLGALPDRQARSAIVARAMSRLSEARALSEALDKLELVQRAWMSRERLDFEAVYQISQ